MDWTQALTILGVFIAGFVYMMSRMDQKFSHMDDKFEHLGERIGKVENHLTALEAETKAELRNINQRLSTIEGYLVPKKVYRFVDRVEERDEPKEE